jgi:hypothetical protein
MKAVIRGVNGASFLVSLDFQVAPTHCRLFNIDHDMLLPFIQLG